MARWNSCNILHFAPEAKRLWQFDAKGGGFALAREHRVGHTDRLPLKHFTKSWTSLWQPKLNVAWLPPEGVFLKVVELPASNFSELFAMVEFQLEKLSPVPLVQIVWTMHLLPSRRSTPPAPPGEGVAVENLQTVVVVIVDRKAVEQFLGRLEGEGFQPDRLEVPMLDQLDLIGTAEDGVWFFPVPGGAQEVALTAWQSEGTLRHLSFVSLPATGDRGAELKRQLEIITWSGEVEGWFSESARWHLVVEAARAADWEQLLRGTVEGAIVVSAPPTPVELAARTARRAATAEAQTGLLPLDYTTRFHQQFVDRLWLRGLLAAAVLYGFCVIIYFCAVAVLGYKTQQKEQQVLGLSGAYTNSLQLQAQYGVLKERQDLKFAALDVWKLVAEELPTALSLQRLSFADGRRLGLNGNCTAEQIGLIADAGKFYDQVRKAKRDGQLIFNQDPASGEQLLYHPLGGTGNYTWNFALELNRTEAEANE